MQWGRGVGALALAWLAVGCGSVVIDESSSDGDGPPSNLLPGSTAGSTSGGSGGAPATSAVAASTSGVGGALPTEDTILATGLEQPTFVALTEDHVYVTEAGFGLATGSLARVAKNGGPLDRVVPNQDRPYAIAIANGYVAWSNYGSGYDGSIKRLSLADDSVETLTTNLGYPWAIAWDGDDIAFSELMTQSIRKVTPNQAVSTLANNLGNVAPLIADGGTFMFFAQDAYNGPNNAVVARFDQGGLVPVYPDLAFGHAVARTGDVICFTTDDGTIRRGTILGAAPTTLATNQGMILDGVIGGGYFYYTRLMEGVVARVPLDGGPVEVLATGQSYPEGIAVDDNAVYWVNQTNGELHKLSH